MSMCSQVSHSKETRFYNQPTINSLRGAYRAVRPTDTTRDREVTISRPSVVNPNRHGTGAQTI